MAKHISTNNNNNNPMETVQEYELKIGVIHHPSLKTVQLIEFLQNQANQFLTNDLPQYVKGDQKFISIMENIPITDPHSIPTHEFQQFVGLLLIYSTSSDQSYQHIIQIMQQILVEQMGDCFMIVVEMDNSQKSANMVGNAGERFCQKNAIQFVRLTLYNSEDLISGINKNLYELIENYYYPNEEIEPLSGGERPYVNNDGNTEVELQQIKGLNGSRDSNYKQKLSNPLSERKSQQQNSTQRSKHEQYVFSYDQESHVINAYNESYSPKVQNNEEMISHAASLRRSRQQQISMQQENLDESIQNIQNVLNNINHRIKQKLNSGWFTQIKQKLYSTAEKDNANFSKIKLTQQFIDQYQLPKKSKKYTTNYHSVSQSRYSDVLNNSSKNFALNFNTLKFNLSSIKTPILRLVLFLSKQKVVQLQIYENSTYDQLALIALRRFELNQTEKNIQKMIAKIKKRIEGFSKQLHKAIKIFQEKKIHQRSFIKSKTLIEQ